MPTPYDAQVLADSPLVYWPLDATRGAADQSGNSRDGTLVSTTDVAGPIQSDAYGAKAFDNAAGRVSSSYNPFTVGASLTFEIWCKRNATTDGDCLIGGEVASGGTFLLRLQAGADTLNFYPQASLAASWASCGIGTGAWHHVVVAFDNAGNSATLYVDGVSKGSQAATDDFLAAAHTLSVGVWRQIVTFKDYFNGSLARMAIYSGLLTADRVLAHYNAGIAAGQALVVAQRGLSVTLDGSDITAQVEGLTFSNSDPGGYEACGFTLAGERLVRKGAPIAIRDGLDVAWLGRAAEGGVSVDGTKATTRVSGEGAQAKLSDSVMAMVYADTALGSWTAMDAARRGSLQVSGNDLGDDPRIDLAQTARRLALSITGGATAATKIAEAWYDAGQACSIAYVIAAAQEQATNAPWATAAWNLVVTTLTAALTTVSASADYTASASPLVATIPGSSAAQRAVVQWYWTGGAGVLNAAKAYDVYLPAIGVYGPHGLTLRGDALSGSNLTAPQGVDPADVAADVAKRAGIPLVVAPLSGFVNRQASYRDYVTHRSIIEEQARLLAWHWGVWAGGSSFDPQPEFHFRPPPSEATGQVARGDCAELDVQSRLADAYNIAVVKYQDPSAGDGYVSLQIDNPALDDTRVLEADMGAGTAATALAYARFVLLNSLANARAAGTAQLPRTVALPGGGQKPAHLLRAGIDRLRITGLPGIRDQFAADTRALDTFHVARVETTVDRAGVPSSRVELDAGASLIETLTARLASV